MDENSCNASHVGQAGQSGHDAADEGVADDRKPTGQSGTGQSDAGGDPAAPRDYDDDPQAGGGRLDQVGTNAPAGGADASSHGSR